MSSESETPSLSDEERIEQAKKLLQTVPSARQPANAGQQAVLDLLQRVQSLEAELASQTVAAAENRDLYLAGLLNLEMRLNMVFSILHDLANVQVKFEGREYHGGDRHGKVDWPWYYDQYLAKVEKDKQAAEAAKAAPESPYPEDAIIFGGKS